MDWLKAVLENPDHAGLVIALAWIVYLTKEVAKLQKRLNYVIDRQLENREALQQVGLIHKTDIGEY